jgi:glycerol-3-phosphate acyltransferase PlsY
MLRTGIINHLATKFDSFAIFWCGFAAALIFAYLLGSVNTSILVSRLVYRSDIRKHGSGNGGLTNMHRTFGLKAAGLTLLGDMLKTIIAVLIPMFFFGFLYENGVCANELSYLSGMIAVLGHVYPIYYGFKGGKGVLVTSTMALVVSPAIFGFLFLVFVGTVALFKYISLGSVTVATLYPVCLNFYFTTFIKAKIPSLIIATTIFLAIFIVWLHRENLKRIGERTERKFSFKKKPTVTEIPTPIEDEDDDEE